MAHIRSDMYWIWFKPALSNLDAIRNMWRQTILRLRQLEAFITRPGLDRFHDSSKGNALSFIFMCL
jgi:hypothetical protein